MPDVPDVPDVTDVTDVTAVTDALLSARGLGRQVRDHDPARAEAPRVLFRGLDLDLFPGERLAVTGPSGTGKTLLLRALALLDPAEGRVLYRGRERSGRAIPWFRSRVVYLHQRPAPLADTVAADLAAPFAFRTHRTAGFPRERALRLLRALGRDESFLSRPTSVLSGGESELVALVRALLLEPEVLLLDEATASLDPAAAAAAERALLAYLGEGERACVFVAHEAALVERLATRRLALGAP